MLGCRPALPGDSPKTRNFDGPEEFLENPDVNDAVDESEIPIYDGDDPPRLAGEYAATGRVVGSGGGSSTFTSAYRNARLASTICLFNQTASGRIDLKEEVSHNVLGALEAWASGGYITGDGDRFTIWQDSRQQDEITLSLAMVGQPGSVTISTDADVTLIMSGERKPGGGFDNVRGMTTFTRVAADVTGSVTDDQRSRFREEMQKLKGFWYMYEANFALQGACSGGRSRSSELGAVTDSPLRAQLAEAWAAIIKSESADQEGD